MNSKKNRALGGLIALLMSLLIGCTLQPTETTQQPPAATTETSPDATLETPSPSGPTVNTEEISECDPGIPGHCYAPLRSGPQLINEPSYVLNLSDTCHAGESVDKSGCVPDHGDEIDVLCQINGDNVNNSFGQSNSIWLGVDIADFHTNESAEVLYETSDGTPVGLLSQHFVAGASNSYPDCELAA